MYKKNIYLWFSVIEILVWILITSMILLTWFFSVSSANIGRIKLISETQLEKEVFYFQEKMTEIIKLWWTIDYEEYFNRMVVDSNKTTLYGSWHYYNWTGFWHGNWVHYYCRSLSWVFMWTGGCVEDFNSFFAPTPTSIDYTWNHQLYGQYRYMGIDYNSDFQDGDNDFWDADGDLNIVWDDDDLFLWDVPTVFSWNWEVAEIYLISWSKKNRTFLRWNVKRDPQAPLSYTCDLNNLKPWMTIWNWCIGMIEVLKLEWVDWWNDHNVSNIDTTQYDGIIDTWIYDRNFYGLTTSLPALTNTQDYWIPLFSSTVNVKQASFFLYPNKDSSLAWKDSSPATNISPYIRISLLLTPKYEKQKSIKWDVPEFRLSTTFNLSPLTSY